MRRSFRLNWWATDTLSLKDMTYILQARELVRARTEYTHHHQHPRYHAAGL